MSLDVTLTQKGLPKTEAGSGIFVRENGQTKEISRAEWDKYFPDREPIVAYQSEEDEAVFDYNITHNLGQMASEARIYAALWRPDEIEITEAVQLIEPLRAGLERLILEPGRFKAFNPSNGWGDYDGLVSFVRTYLTACEKYPNAKVSVSR